MSCLITMLSFPQHSSQRLQPLERLVYGPSRPQMHGYSITLARHWKCMTKWHKPTTSKLTFWWAALIPLTEVYIPRLRVFFSLRHWPSIARQWWTPCVLRQRKAARHHSASCVSTKPTTQRPASAQSPHALSALRPREAAPAWQNAISTKFLQNAKMRKPQTAIDDYPDNEMYRWIFFSDVAQVAYYSLQNISRKLEFELEKCNTHGYWL